MLRWALIFLPLLGCKKKDRDADNPPPLGMPLFTDDVIYAGAVTIDMTPDIGETWDDLDGDAYFSGCLDDPSASATNCLEPFNDTNGNGIFEPTWIGGFGPLRPALEVHDPIEANAVVLAYNGEYVALVGLDLVGLSQIRINAAMDALEKDGFERDRLLAASTHNHQGPDTMGLWGDPYTGVTGMNEAYQQRVTATIEEAVREAAANMEPVSLRVGSVLMRDLEPEWFNGSMFGGSNPTAKMQGMINDIRDPVVVSDQVLVLQGTGDRGTVFTWTNWSGHPETWGSQNAISSDWVGVTRDVLEDQYGGIAIHMPESLGGMQSALGGDLPLVDSDGNWVMNGSEPEWAPRDSWEYVWSHGWHIADAVTAALESGEDVNKFDIQVEAEPVIFPVTNISYQLLGSSGLFDLGVEDAIFDSERCPEIAFANDLGCLETRTWRVSMGPIGLLGVPGELLPELARGFPGDAAWTAEVADPTARGAGSTYFPQHDSDCDSLSFEDECTNGFSSGECDCLKIHAWPYVLSPDPAQMLMLDPFDDKYTAVLGMLGDYLSYIIPEPDFNHSVSLFTDDGDHYEDTVSPGDRFATKIQEAQAKIDQRW